MATITHELIISAQKQAVHEALTSISRLSNWWTNAEKVSEKNIRFHFGESYFKEMVVVKSDENEINWECISGASEWLETTISFHLKSGTKSEIRQSNPEISGQLDQNADDVTLLVFRHDNWKDQTAMFAECNYTWAMFLSSLKSYCETGAGKPWPNQHQL